VIQLTGVAARRAGYWVGFFLCILGLFPVVGEWMAVMPKPVLGGITLLLFGFVASAGVKLIAEETLNSRSMLILAVALACGIGVQSAPQLLDPLPSLLKAVFHSPVTAGGMLALALNVILPKE
jgi:xanthine permease XanP